jgi:hypothetical protein
MKSGGNIVAFKTPFEAHEHCRQELAEWRPQWQAALKGGDAAELGRLIDHYRRRVLAVFPKAQYRGSWAGAMRGFSYRLYEFSEFDDALQHMTESRSLYEETLQDLAPDWNKSVKAPELHCYAEILLRLAEVSRERAWLDQAKTYCEQASAVWDGEHRRHQATLGAVLRRTAEITLDAKDCDAALTALASADVDQDVSNGDLSWALQRRTLAAVLMLKHRMSSDRGALTVARAAVQEAIDNYQVNPHKFWIRPSSLEDALSTRASIEAELGG